MKELYRDRHLVQISRFQALLEAAGLPTFIRNEALSQAEAPIPTFMPALCVVNDADYDQAVAIIRDTIRQAEESPATERPCPVCKEMNPGSFEICWNCGKDLDPAASA
jgi:hypothetical protein